MKDSQSAIQKSKGSILWRFSQKFQFAADKIIPDSLVFCLILTFFVFFAALIFTGNNPMQLLNYWYDGLWTQLSFAMQMSLMVIVCATCAKSSQVTGLLDKMSQFIKSPAMAMIVLMIWGYFASFINWAFCSLSCAVFAMQISKRVKGTHFPLMVVAGYCTSCLGQCLGPTASVYALLATPGNYMEAMLGGVFSQDVTVYNPINVTIFMILAILTVALAVMTRPPKDDIIEFDLEDSVADKEKAEWSNIDRSNIAGRLNGSRIIMWLIGIGGVAIVIYNFLTHGFLGALTLNFIIFIFLTINCFLYSTPMSFVGAHKDSMKLATEVMLQFPFYGGIAGIMADSGLASIVVAGIVNIATVKTLPIWSYISASFVNLFIPPQGGQFIIQGPLLVDAAQQMGADVMTVINAFVYGDEATNLLQPLYIIPPLAMVGAKLKDVWGFMAFIWVFWTVFTVLGFIIVPGLF